MSLTLTSALRGVCLLALVGPRPFCRPTIPPGPSAVDQAAQAVTITVRDEPTGHITFWVRAGFALDPPGFEGLAHATAHALSANHDVAQIHTDAEWVRLRVPCRTTECATDFASALVAGPTEGGWSAARDRAQDTLATPHSTSTIAAAWLFEGHPYGHLPAGRTGSLTAMNGPRLAQFHRSHYVRSTVHAVVDTHALADALAPVLEPLPTALPVDFPLQQPEPIGASRALVVDAPMAAATAAVTVPDSAIAQVVEAIETLDEAVQVQLVGGLSAEFPRRQAHLEVTTHAKTGHYAARHLQDALRTLRCDTTLTEWLQHPTVVIAGPDPEATIAAMGEEVPHSRVYCSDDTESAVSILDLESVVLVAREDLFR